MACLARVAAAGIAHHVTQRGNRSHTVFFGRDDHEACEGLLAEDCVKAGVEVWGFRLTPNHIVNGGMSL